jgi:hypothetical protein
MATLPELAEHGIVGSADVLPVAVGPAPQEQGHGARAKVAELIGDAKSATDRLVEQLAESVRDRREHEHPTWEDLFCLNLVSWAGERMGPVLRRLLDAEARVAELEAAPPSRFTATPAEVDAYLRTVLAEDTYLRFQQEIGAQALHEVVEDAQKVRASADNDGLYNADWREGWDDAIERVDPDSCGPSPSTLVEFANADGITRRIAPTQALREDEPTQAGGA